MSEVELYQIWKDEHDIYFRGGGETDYISIYTGYDYFCLKEQYTSNPKRYTSNRWALLSLEQGTYRAAFVFYII